MSKLGAKRPETVVEFCTDFDLQAEHDIASAELAALNQRESQTLASPAKRAVAKKVVDLEKKMLDSIVCFTLQALPRKRWAELESAHQPREDNTVDAHYRVNMETFIDAVMSEAEPVPVIVSVTKKSDGSPVDFGPGDWNAEADEMTNAQWDQFALAVLALNRGKVTPGFNKAAWQQTQTPARKSK